MNPPPARLKDWTPVRIRPADGHMVIDWCHLGALRFTEPCFKPTVAAAMRQPARVFFLQTTTLDVLEGFGSHGSLLPTAFIFHLSRSGSYLLARMLSACPRNIVIAEAPPIDALLHAASLDPESRLRHIARLRGLIHALGQRRGKTARYFFIAFDSWHTLDLPLILDTFPAVPWVFLFRDPVEVLLSHQRIRGLHMVPGAIGVRSGVIGPVGPGFAGLDDYGARVLAEIGRVALRHADRGRSRFVHARQLPDILEAELERFFETDYTCGETALMRGAARFDTGFPSAADVVEPEGSQLAASPALQELAQRWLGPLAAQLEARCHATSAEPPPAAWPAASRIHR